MIFGGRDDQPSIRAVNASTWEGPECRTHRVVPDGNVVLVPLVLDVVLCDRRKKVSTNVLPSSRHRGPGERLKGRDIGTLTVVLDLNAEEIVEHAAALLLGELIDPLRKSRVDVDRAQAGDGVGAVRASWPSNAIRQSQRCGYECKNLACVPNDGVRSLEGATGVERAPSGLGAELEPVLRRLLTEAVRVVKRRQTLEELLVARGEAIVGVVVGRPKGAARRPNSSVFVSVCALA
jgi:hypothetical protein